MISKASCTHIQTSEALLLVENASCLDITWFGFDMKQNVCGIICITRASLKGVWRSTFSINIYSSVCCKNSSNLEAYLFNSFSYLLLSCCHLTKQKTFRSFKITYVLLPQRDVHFFIHDNTCTIFKEANFSNSNISK